MKKTTREILICVRSALVFGLFYGGLLAVAMGSLFMTVGSLFAGVFSVFDVKEVMCGVILGGMSIVPGCIVATAAGLTARVLKIAPKEPIEGLRNIMEPIVVILALVIMLAIFLCMLMVYFNVFSLCGNT